MDKPLVASATVWGAVIAGVGEIAVLIGTPLASGQPIDWGVVIPKVVAVVGLVVAAIGARRAVGAVIAK